MEAPHQEFEVSADDDTIENVTDDVVAADKVGCAVADDVGCAVADEVGCAVADNDVVFETTDDDIVADDEVVGAKVVEHRVPALHGDIDGLPVAPGAGAGDEAPVKKRRKETCVLCGPTYENVHRIPKREPLRGIWIQALGLRPGGVKMSARVCAVHFVPGEDVPCLMTRDATGNVVEPMDVEVDPTVETTKVSEENRLLIMKRIEELEMSDDDDVVDNDVVDNDVVIADKVVNTVDDDAADITDASLGADEVDNAAVGAVASNDVTGLLSDADKVESGIALPPKKAWMLMSQVESLKAELADVLERLKAEQRSSLAKDDEITMLRQQAEVLIRNEQALKDELEQSRKNAKNRGDMLRRTRNARDQFKVNPRDSAVKSVLKGRLNVDPADVSVIFRGKEVEADKRKHHARRWSKEKIVDGLIDRCISARSYRRRQKQKSKYALPSETTLRRYIRNFRADEGMLTDAIDVIKAKLEAMDEDERKLHKPVVLGFDDYYLRLEVMRVEK